jgi:Protein of unknown function (DUF4058)
MPLRNHFVPPLSVSHPWTGFHSAWATTIAQQLNRDLLPPRFYAIPNVQLGGPIEIDVATLERADGGETAVPGAPTSWKAPEPAVTALVDFSLLDVIEVQVMHDEGGPLLTAAIELVSPANKNRPGHRRAFAVKCASYLQAGASVIVVDLVTDREANLHAEIMRLLETANGAVWEAPTHLYAVAYRTIAVEEQRQIQAWPEVLTIGANLPTLPLWLGTDFTIPLNLETSYQTTCDDLRIRIGG